MKYERAVFFGVGLLVGAGALCFVKSKKGHDAAVAIASKGLELGEKVTAAVERVRETAGDVLAEAKYLNGQKTNTE
jgi:hypothetical protein